MIGEGLRFTLDIEIYDTFGPGHWAQARYLVHGSDDVLWTDEVEDVVSFLRADLERERLKADGGILHP